MNHGTAKDVKAALNKIPLNVRKELAKAVRGSGGGHTDSYAYGDTLHGLIKRAAREEVVR